MHPVIDLRIGGEISSYRLMLFAALIVTVAVAMLTARHLGIRRRALLMAVVGASVGAVVGARVLAVATASADGLDLGERLSRMSAGDFALYGGLIGGGLVGLAVCGVVGINPPRVADALAPALGAGIITMRVGCLLAGCCFGTPTHLPWGITYPSGSTPHLHQILTGDSIFSTISAAQPVHPIPIYEMIVALTGAMLAGFVIRRGWREGSAMAVFILWYSLWRVLVEPLRADTGTTIMAQWFWPAVFLSAAAAAIQWLFTHRPAPIVSG